MRTRHRIREILADNRRQAIQSSSGVTYSEVPDTGAALARAIGWAPETVYRLNRSPFNSVALRTALRIAVALQRPVEEIFVLAPSVRISVGR